MPQPHDIEAVPENVLVPPPQYPLCAHMRCKGMFVTDEPYTRQTFADGDGSTHFWCQLTARSLGPDGRMVHVHDCHEERRCYETA